MDMKEKLVELLKKARVTFYTALFNSDYYDFVADRLIANGVTVVDKFATTEQQWISVKDRLPIEEAKAHEQEWCEEYCEFLVMIDRGFLPTTLYYDWEENEWFRINTALKREKYKVTHWMPLPKPPKGD